MIEVHYYFEQGSFPYNFLGILARVARGNFLCAMIEVHYCFEQASNHTSLLGHLRAQRAKFGPSVYFRRS